MVPGPGRVAGAEVAAPPSSSDEAAGPAELDVVEDPELPTAAPAGQETLEGDHRLVPGGPAGAPDYSPAALTTAWSYQGPSLEPTARLYTRRIEGVQVDVRANRYPDPDSYGWGHRVPFATPPGWCFPSGRLYAGLRTSGAVGQAWGSRYDEVRPGTMVVTGTVVGAPEEEPRWLVLVQAPVTVGLVTARFPGGGTDTMVPVEGIAVLTAAVDDSVELDEPWGADQPDLRVVGVDGTHGDVVYEGHWSGGTAPGAGGVAAPPPPDPACLAPRALPDPGAEQPADPAGAEGAVRATWASVFNLDRADDVALALVDDPDGVDVALERMRQGPFWPDTVAAASVVLDDMVFAGPTTAYVGYHVEVAGIGSVFDDRFGELRLVDGTWKVTRATVCEVLALGGGTCPPEGG